MNRTNRDQAWLAVEAELETADRPSDRVLFAANVADYAAGIDTDKHWSVRFALWGADYSLRILKARKQAREALRAFTV